MGAGGGMREWGRAAAWLLVLLLLVPLLAGCIDGLAGGAGAPPAGIMGPAVEVTPLAPLPAAALAVDESPVAAAHEDAAPDAVPPAGAVTDASATDAATPPDGESAADAAPLATPAVAPASPDQLACEGAGGIWTRLKSGGRLCARRTRDANRACARKSDCRGECLARSRTCAPFAPLPGCNDILDDRGRRMTLCLDPAT